MRIPPIAGLEIGTSRTVVCVGEADSDGRVKITGVGISPTTGVRKGQVTDLALARTGVEAAVTLAAKDSNVTIWQVLLAVSGDHIQVTVNPGFVTLRSSGSTVSREDIEAVKEIARDVLLEDGRQILHTVDQTFTVDDRAGIDNPEGLRCSRLGLSVMAVHGLKKRVDDAISVVKSAQLDATDAVFSGVCSALAVLTEEQKRNGVALIDLGGGTTNYIVYCNKVVVAAGSIAVGGDHVTNDIVQAFGVWQARAEELKKTEGSAIVDAEDSARRVPLSKEVGFEGRMLSCKALHTVINERMDETFRMVLLKLDEAGVLPHLRGGIVLTGGGAYLRKVTELAQRVFGLPCRIGVPVNVEGLENQEQPAALATAAGLALYGTMTYRDRGMLPPWLGKMMSVLGRKPKS
jgi:cell division protein FtsA